MPKLKEFYFTAMLPELACQLVYCELKQSSVLSSLYVTQWCLYVYVYVCLCVCVCLSLCMCMFMHTVKINIGYRRAVDVYVLVHLTHNDLGYWCFLPSRKTISLIRH